MEDNVISVEPETDQEDVARLVSKYDLHAIPVVNKRMGIIGIITVDDIIDVIEEENTEDMLKLGRCQQGRRCGQFCPGIGPYAAALAPCQSRDGLFGVRHGFHV